MKLNEIYLKSRGGGVVINFGYLIQTIPNNYKSNSNSGKRSTSKSIFFKNVAR